MVTVTSREEIVHQAQDDGTADGTQWGVWGAPRRYDSVVLTTMGRPAGDGTGHDQ
jgi:hypothetical protein